MVILPEMVSIREKVFVIAVLTCFYLIEAFKRYQPYTFLHGDGAFYAQINRGLFKSFTFRQEEFQPASWYEAKLGWNRNLSDSWSNVAIGKNNKWYPKHSLLMPLFSTPFYAVFGSAGLLIFNLFALITALYFTYIITRRFFEPLPSFASIMLTAVSPIFTRGAYSYSNDIFYAALLAIFLHFFLGRRMFISGFFAGLALWAKPTNIIFIAPAAIFFSLAVKPTFKELFKSAAAASVPVALFLASNYVMFGSPLTTSYDRILVVKNGVQETVSYRDFFNLPFYDGLIKILSDGSEGLIRNAIFSLIGLAGILVLLLKSYPAALFIAASAALFFYLFAKFPYIYARFFSPFALVSSIPLAALLNLPFGGRTDKPVLSDQQNENRFNIWFKLVPAFILVFTAIIFTIHFHTVKRPNSLAANLESLKVSLGETPCDYFNMSHDRWECSHLDRGPGNFTGKAAEGDCSGFEQGMLYIPLSASFERRIIWGLEAAKGSVLKVRYINKGVEDVNLRIQTSAGAEKTLILKRTKEPVELRYTVESNCSSVSFVFPASGRDGGSVCLNAEN